MRDCRHDAVAEALNSAGSVRDSFRGARRLPFVAAPVVLAIGTRALRVQAGSKPPLKNAKLIDRLIQCESSGRNISRPDSDGINSDGILQFHRGKHNTMDGGTLQDMSRRSGITGSPMIPEDAKRMSDWMIENGFLSRWTCAKILGLSRGRS